MYLQDDSTDRYSIPEPLKGRLTIALDLIQENLNQTLYSLRHEDGVPIEETWLYEELPPRLRTKVNELMCLGLTTTLKAVREKLFSEKPVYFGCQAEEILLWWSLNMAKVLPLEDDSDIERVGNQVGECFDLLFPDLDFELIFDPSFDGIEENEGLGVRTFRVEDWFKPYQLV